MQTALFVASGLLLLGFVLRATVKPLQALFIPAAVIGGILGFIILTAVTPLRFTLTQEFQKGLDEAVITNDLHESFVDQHESLSAEASVTVVEAGKRWQVEDNHQTWAIVIEAKRLNVYHLRLPWDTKQVVDELRTWPSWLITVIFAGLLIERPSRSFRQSIKLAAREGIVVWIIILGEITLGLLATWLVVIPFFEEPVPGSFGQLIEAGFAGGHGTAGALGDVFENILHFEAGKDLGFVFATVGLVFGVVSGIVYVNIAVRRGWTRAGQDKIEPLSGLEDRNEPKPIAFGKVRSEVIEPLVFQALILASAFALGIVLKWLVMEAIRGGSDIINVNSDEVMKYAGNLPLFMFSLVAGLVVRELMHFFKIDDLIDADGIRHITAAAMEFLIVAAIASLKLSALIKFGWPLLLLLLLGFVWTGICLFIVARRLLPKDYWFELGILNYGMSTGTTAQGLMLLRIIDKDLESGAAEDYALAAPLSAPFIGGGVITLIVLPILLEKVPMGLVVAGLAVLIGVFYYLGRQMADDRG